MSYIRKVKFKNIKKFGLDFFGKLYKKPKYKILNIFKNTSFNKKRKKTKNFLVEILKKNYKLTKKFFVLYKRLVLKEQYSNIIKYKIVLLNKKKKTKRNYLIFLKRRRQKFKKNYNIIRQKKPFFEKLNFFKQFQWYYGNMSRVRIKHFFLNFKKSKKVKINDILFMLESKLDVFVFKCGFLSSILEAKNLIKSGKIFVNDRLIKNPNFLLNDSDIVYFSKDVRLFYYSQLISRLKSHNVFFFQPFYAEINFGLMSAIILKNQLIPTKLKFPINFNILSIKNIFRYF